MRTPHGNRLDHSTSQLRSGTRIGKWSQNALNMDTESRETVPTFRRAIHRRLQTSGRVSDVDDPPKAGQRSRQCLRQEPKSQILKKSTTTPVVKGTNVSASSTQSTLTSKSTTANKRVHAIRMQGGLLLYCGSLKSRQRTAKLRQRHRGSNTFNHGVHTHYLTHLVIIRRFQIDIDAAHTAVPRTLSHGEDNYNRLTTGLRHASYGAQLANESSE